MQMQMRRELEGGGDYNEGSVRKWRGEERREMDRRKGPGWIGGRLLYICLSAFKSVLKYLERAGFYNHQFKCNNDSNSQIKFFWTPCVHCLLFIRAPCVHCLLYSVHTCTLCSLFTVHTCTLCSLYNSIHL